MLHERASGHKRGPVALGQGRYRGADVVEMRVDPNPASLDDQLEGVVDDVLARAADVHRTPCPGGGQRGEGGHDRDGGIAGQPSRPRQLGHVEAAGLAHRGYGLGMVTREYARFGGGAGERGFDVQDGLEQLGVTYRWTQKGIEQLTCRHGQSQAKKAVS